MALSAGTIYDIRSAGSDTNGGGFDPTNANFATDLAATSGNTSAPVVTSASYNFIARDVGAWVFVKSGTSWTPGWYQIASTASNAATLTAGIGTAYLYEATAHVPYAVTTAAGCATVASPTAGTWGIDYSQNGAALFTYTDMVIDGTTNTIFTSAANPVGKHIVSNLINVSSGTGFTVQTVQVVSTSGTQATCDKSLGTLSSTGGNGKLGGSLASPGAAGALNVAGNKGFIYNSGGGSPTTYVIGSGTANTSGNGISIGTAGSQSSPAYWIGWDTARHVLATTANKPRLLGNASASFTLFASTSSSFILKNIYFGNNGSFTTFQGLSLGSFVTIVENLDFNTVPTAFTSASGTSILFNCLFDTCTVTCSSFVGYLINFVIRNGTGTGIGTGTGNFALINGLIYNCAGTGISIAVGNNAYVRNVVIYKMTGGSGNGIALSSSTSTLSYFENCVSYGNSQRNYHDQAATHSSFVRFFNCAGGSGGTADDVEATALQGFITLTADPFQNGATGDFRLKNNAGGGALLIGLGSPQLFPGLTQANFPDAGAYQTQGQAAGFSSAPNIVFRRRVR